MKCNTIKLLFDIRRSIVVVAEWQMSLAHSLAFIAVLARRKKFESNQVKYPGECEEIKRMHAWNFQWLFVDFSSCVSSASSTQISCINFERSSRRYFSISTKARRRKRSFVRPLPIQWFIMPPIIIFNLFSTRRLLACAQHKNSLAKREKKNRPEKKEDKKQMRQSKIKIKIVHPKINTSKA